MTDFVQGIRAASMMDAVVERRRQNEVDNVVGLWSQRCSELTANLDSARGEVKRTALTATEGYAHWHGERSESKALRDALAQVNPSHPLLKEGALKGVHDAAAARYASERGYSYDPATGDLRPVSR